MTQFDSVGNSDNFNFRGFSSFLLVCERRSQAMRKRWNVCTIMVLLHIYIESLGVSLPVCHGDQNQVLMHIKL